MTQDRRPMGLLTPEQIDWIVERAAAAYRRPSRWQSFVARIREFFGRGE